MVLNFFKRRSSEDTAPVGDIPRRVPEGRRVYAIGDIHGRLDLLQILHQRIRTDHDGRAEAEGVIVYVGDYIDRGRDSQAVVELLCGAPLPGFSVVCLKGNHEQSLLTFLEDIKIGPSWLYYGGAETLTSYGIVASSLEQDTERLTAHQAALREALPAHHLAFLQTLPLTHREGDYLFAHAGIRPGVAIEAQKPRDLMWIRDKFLTSPRDHGCIVVHGHSITPAPDVKANRIGIDTGAYQSGVLTCLALEGEERRFIQTG